MARALVWLSGSAYARSWDDLARSCPGWRYACRLPGWSRGISMSWSPAFVGHSGGHNCRYPDPLRKFVGGPDDGISAIPGILNHPLLQGASGAVEIEHEGRCEDFLQRSVCCFAYRLPQYPHCATCLLLSVDQRWQRLVKLMDGRS